MTVPLGTARRSRLARVVMIAVVGGLASLGLVSASASTHTASAHTTYKREAGGSPLTAHVWVKPGAVGALDCNGMSPVQTPSVGKVCTDIRGMYGVNNKWTWGGRFYDNGRYIGHDEPFIRFLSARGGSGNNIVWRETLGRDPASLPTVNKPGHDVTHYFELSIAPWFGMALCNPFSYPLLPCKPNSDLNAPASVNAPTPPGQYPGAGSSFLETQFYPPGQAPFIDDVSCDNTHWCASLHINDAECTLNFADCNGNCPEPTNFAFIQTNGVPTGPPGPQLTDVATMTPNTHTLLMNSGDRLVIHIWDAPVPGRPGQRALEESIHDLTTGKFGFMQASAKNGFMATHITDCSGTPFNYQPEYNTASKRNIVPWAADQLAVGTQFEIGHFEACTSLAKPFSTAPYAFGFNDQAWNQCFGPYEKAAAPDSKTPEAGDGFCYPKGDTHSGNAPPNEITGCLDDVFQNGDLDFDGSPYWPDWPNSTKPDLFPSTFRQAQPTTFGHRYPLFQFQTDAALSELSCHFPSGVGCDVPPPGAPGKFYPYWTLTKSCTWEFGNMTNGRTFGKADQYGTTIPKIGYPQLFSKVHKNRCA